MTTFAQTSLDIMTLKEILELVIQCSKIALTNLNTPGLVELSIR